MIIKRRDIAMLHEVRQFIELNFMRELPIATLCKEFGLNRTKLQEGFNQLFSVSVHGLIFRKRMERARWMLKETDEPVKCVAMECGYKTLSSFTRVFTRLHSMSPSKYREMNSNKEMLLENTGEMVK